MAAIASVSLTGPSLAQAGDADLAAYERLLADPSGVGSNLAYAQELQATGRGDEARELYRKVLTLDPGNAAATSGLAGLGTAAVPPAQTDYTLRAGVAYETNSPRRPPNFRSFDDFLAFGELTVNDTRRIGDQTFQSNFDIYGNFHNRYSPADIGYVAADTGPLYNLENGGKLRVAIGGEYVLQGTSPIPTNSQAHNLQYEFSGANLIFNYLPPQPQYLQSVNLLLGYNTFRQAEAGRSGFVIRTTSPFSFPGWLPFNSELIVNPGFVYNGANTPTATLVQPAHYVELNLDVLALTPIAEQALGADRIVGKLGIFADAQFYDGADPGLTSDRRDQRLVPLVGVRWVNFLVPRLQVDLDYRFDHNFSNDPSQRFSDHIFSLTGTYRF